LTDERFPATGDFDNAALASARTIDPAQWNSDAPILGLVREAGYLWGTVRDDEGAMFSVMRRIPPGVDLVSGEAGDRRGLGGRLVLLSTLDAGENPGTALRVRREPKGAASSDELNRHALPQGVRFSSPAHGDGRAMRADLTADSLDYSEENVLELAGTRSCPALQWYLPGPEAALLYLTQTWEVEGVVLDRPVRGFLFWEEAYMQPGARLYVEKDPLHDAGYTSWYSWATRWDDGVTEVGHFLTGARSFGVGVVAASTGDVSVARRVAGRVELTRDHRWHAGIDYDMDGVAWRCEPDPVGRMELGPMLNPQQEGRVHRRGETRAPVVHMAWGETVPARLRD
jgi:hypothetical protein